MEDLAKTRSAAISLSSIMDSTSSFTRGPILTALLRDSGDTILEARMANLSSVKFDPYRNIIIGGSSYKHFQGKTKNGFVISRLIKHQ